jgi:hypothetical protein
MLRTGLSPSSTRSIQRHSRLVGTLWTASETNDDSGRDIPLQETCQRRREIYAPISVIYGELQDLFMEIVPNVGLFIQFSVGLCGRDKCKKNSRHAVDTRQFYTRTQTGRGLDTKKREPVSRLPFGGNWFVLEGDLRCELHNVHGRVKPEEVAIRARRGIEHGSALPKCGVTQEVVGMNTLNAFMPMAKFIRSLKRMFL